MQFKGFSGLRTYDYTLQRDLRELERYLGVLDAKLGALNSTDTISVVGSTQGVSPLALHAFTHATGGTDSIDPYAFTWRAAHVWTPSHDIVPVTINPSGATHTADTLNVTDINSVLSMRMSALGKAGFNAPTLNAQVNIRTSGFLPTQISDIYAWYKADSLSLSNGASVTSWPDSSGNGHTAVSFVDGAASQPVGPPVYSLAGGPSSMPCVFVEDPFFGTTRMLSVTAPTILDPPFTIFAIHKQTFDEGSHDAIILGNNNSLRGENTYAYFPSRNGASTRRAALVWNASTVNCSNTQTADDYSYHIMCVKVTSSGTTKTHFYYEDGVNDSTNAGAGTATIIATPGLYVDYLLGSKPGPTTYNNGTGYWAEIIIYARDLTDVERNSVENYLAGKWGMSGGSLTPSTSGGYDILEWQSNAGALLGQIDSTGHMGVGVDPTIRLQVRDTTTPQVRVEYNGTHHLDVSVSSTGVTTFDTTGASTNFSDPVIITSTTANQLSTRYDASNRLDMSITSGGVASIYPTSNLSLGASSAERLLLTSTAATPSVPVVMGSTVYTQYGARTAPSTPASGNRILFANSATSDRMSSLRSDGVVIDLENHGLSGSFVGTTDTQTLTNKSLVDASTWIIDDVDATKKMQFQCASISAGTTRTVTIPDSNFTIAGSNRAEVISQAWEFQETVTFDKDILGSRAYYTGARTGSFTSGYNVNMDGSELIGSFGLPMPHAGTIIAASAAIYVAVVSHSGTLQLDIAINDLVLFSAVHSLSAGGLHKWTSTATRAVAVVGGVNTSTLKIGADDGMGGFVGGANFVQNDLLRMTIAYGNGLIGNAGRTFVNVGVVFNT